MALSTPPANRLEVELEFVQCLANPYYLHYLAHSKFLEDERFINYVSYLEYFRRPEYAKLLTYPVHSLGALDLLKQPQFRADIMNPAVALRMVKDMIDTFAPEEKEPPPKPGQNGKPPSGDVPPAINGLQTAQQRTNGS